MMNCPTRVMRFAILLSVLVGVFFLSQPGLCAPVSMQVAKQAAQNFLIHVNAARIIQTIGEVQSGGKHVGYLVHLAPQGYILVAGDDIRIPVKGYSLTSAFSDLPKAYTQNLLRELEVPIPNLGGSLSVPADNTNASYWDYLKQPDVSAAISSYTPDTYLLTTRWNQNYPYNKFNPTIGGEATLTGCVQTALAQVIRYHFHPATGSGVFTHTWNGQNLTAGMNRPFNWSSMPNAVNGSVPEYQQEEVAALMRDLAVLNQADFGLDGTTTSFHSSEFARALGYAPISSMSSSNSAFFTTIKNEIDDLRPLLLSMPGHMTVADGYASDGAGRNIHVNLGWGGAHDDYYYLDQTNVIGPYSFSPNHTIHYNIRPCEGGECNPYSSTGGGRPPVISPALPDLVIGGQTTLRVGVYDPDGDTVTLSASSTCNGLSAALNSNLLTLTPLSTDIFCPVTVTARSQDGTTTRTFKVLCLDNRIYLGTHYDIGGQFVDQYEVDEYKAYLGGDITVTGYRGYSNQAFYIWIKNQSGATVLGPSDNPLSGTLTPGIYTIFASLASGSSYYPYNASYSGYILSIADEDLVYTVSDLAASLGISLSQPKPKGMPWIPLLLGD